MTNPTFPVTTRRQDRGLTRRRAEKLVYDAVVASYIHDISNHGSSPHRGSRRRGSPAPVLIELRRQRAPDEAELAPAA
ncbi:MAG: hypothetical protein JO168_23960 [Solirubrobacterales bacterium]|nr:hypothetical protein [Solirubrobacterales bacterium]MBV9713871.1 hypothetical protein [Solirubrobacterales bacterium]